MLDKYDMIEIYTDIYPKLKDFLDSDMKMIDKEIFKCSVPKMLSRDLFNFKSLQIYGPKGDRYIEAFKERYFKHVSGPKLLGNPSLN